MINKKSNTLEFIEKSNHIHKNTYDYSLVEYKNNKTKIKIICPKHGVFEQVPTKHVLRGDGCPLCANKKRGDKIILSKSIFLERSNKIHNNKYNYSQIDYVDTETKIDILCQTHGVFKQQPSSHMYGNGCPKCANMEHGKHNAIDKDIFIYKSENKHNHRYDYSFVNYINIKTKVEILCHRHGTFKQLPTIHMNGSGCPLCQISKGEDKIKIFLDSNNIIYNKEHKFKDCKYKQSLKFDFYLPNIKTCIEYDGEQHFRKWHKGDSDEKLNLRKIRDEIKNDYCENNNIKLLRIPYTELKNIDSILIEKLKNN